MSDFNFTATATRVTNLARAVARGEADYVALVSYFGLTAGSTSADLTDAARSVVIAGAANDGTATGAALTLDMLKGRDPGDVKHRDYWKAARTVRKGLVGAITPDTDDEPKDATLRVTLSGEGGGSATVDLDSDLGKAILKFLSEGK